MNVEEALLVVEKAIWAKAGRHLNDAEVTIFRGSWEGLTYDEMAEQSAYEATYLKGDAGHKLWKLLSEALEEPVGKKNFRAAVERARSRFLLEIGADGRSPFGEVPESQEVKQSEEKTNTLSSSESGDAGEESQSQTPPYSTPEKPKMLWQIILETENLSILDLDAVIAELEKLGEGSIMIKRIEKGSVVLTMESSPEVFERIEYLFKSGQLTEVLGIPVKDVHGGETSAVVNLSQWFMGIFEAGWEPVEALFESQQVKLAFNFRMKNNRLERKNNRLEGCKLLDLEWAGAQVALLVGLAPVDYPEINISVEVHPSVGQIYLPENLQLRVLDEEEISVMKASARSSKKILCEFTGEPGEIFSVKVGLNDASVTEMFLI